MFDLHIYITPHHYNDGADLDINGKMYLLTPAELGTEMDLRILLRDQPDYVYNAVIGMLKEMAS